MSKEMLGAQIASKQNLGFYLWLVKQARARILAGDFGPWKEKMKQKVAQRL
jgi:queuine tRNA-ribosyltransferase